VKTLGLVGGTGWTSTLEYYRIINQEVNRRLGGLNSARMVLYSVNYADVHACNQRTDHEGVSALLCDAARALHRAGAEGLVLCANTTHLYCGAIEAAVPLPIVHIADATAAEIRAAGMDRVGLLGTRLTMEMGFYRDRLRESGIEALVPDEGDRVFIERAIKEEILKELLRDETRARFLQIIEGLVSRGAQGVVLGCTEIPLLVRPQDTSERLFDTLEIHARAAAQWALADG
jgi:aspartate racemase